MNTSGEDLAIRTDDAVEALLEQASPRPIPPSSDEQLIRDAVRAEWQAVAGKRRSRSRIMRFAIAATVVLAVAVSFNTFRVSGIAPVQVATISKSHGSIHLLGKQSQLQKMQDLTVITAGQTIVTGSGSGIGLEWGKGGSLRIDENTRIEFTADDSVFLTSGRIYFDSTPSELASGGSVETVAAITGSGVSPPALVIETEHGTVIHLGTQYMTYSDHDGLSVSVREGQVSIEGQYYDELAREGEQLRVAGSGRPSVTNFKGYGDAWDWIEATSPATQLDDDSVHQFLSWVSHETGLELLYEEAAAEALANEETLRGTVDTEPTNALRVWMMGVDLNWRIEGGTIYVSGID